MQNQNQSSQAQEPAAVEVDPLAIAMRIRRVMAEHQVDGVEFATRVGVPYTTMRAYLSTAPRPPSADFLVGVYRAFGVMPSWLLTGDEPSTRTGVPRLAEAAREQVPIPRYDVRASAGVGVVNDQHAEYKIDAISVPQSWLRGRGLSGKNLRAITVRGSSMQPVLSDGDLVLMDTTDTKPRSGFVYVLRHEDELLVKYCEQLPTGTLRISSANSAFSPYDLDLKKAPNFAVLGRVVASMHDW